MQIIKYIDLMNINGLMFRDWNSVALCAVMTHAFKKAMNPNAKLDTPVEFVSRVLRDGRIVQSRIIDRESLEKDFEAATLGEPGWETHPFHRKPIKLPSLEELVQQADDVLETARALVQAEHLEAEL